eukprot:g1353.t1
MAAVLIGSSSEKRSGAAHEVLDFYHFFEAAKEQFPDGTEWPFPTFGRRGPGHSYKVVVDECLSEHEALAEKVNCAVDQQGHTLLHVASFHGDTDYVSRLASFPQVKLDVGDLFGQTALVLATMMGNTGAVGALLEAGANANIMDDRLYGPIMHFYERVVTRRREGVCVWDMQRGREAATFMPLLSLLLASAPERVSTGQLELAIDTLKGVFADGISDDQFKPGNYPLFADAAYKEELGTLSPEQQAAAIILPVLDCELRGRRRWCAWCLRINPSEQLVGEDGSIVDCLKIKRCRACKTLSYCSSMCQKMHWRHGHKQRCPALASRRKARRQAAKEQKAAAEAETKNKEADAPAESKMPVPVPAAAAGNDDAADDDESKQAAGAAGGDGSSAVLFGGCDIWGGIGGAVGIGPVGRVLKAERGKQDELEAARIAKQNREATAAAPTDTPGRWGRYRVSGIDDYGLGEGYAFETNQIGPASDDEDFDFAEVKVGSKVSVLVSGKMRRGGIICGGAAVVESLRATVAEESAAYKAMLKAMPPEVPMENSSGYWAYSKAKQQLATAKNALTWSMKKLGDAQAARKWRTERGEAEGGKRKAGDRVRSLSLAAAGSLRLAALCNEMRGGGGEWGKQAREIGRAASAIASTADGNREAGRKGKSAGSQGVKAEDGSDDGKGKEAQSDPFADFLKSEEYLGALRKQAEAESRNAAGAAAQTPGAKSDGKSDDSSGAAKAREEAEEGQEETKEPDSVAQRQCIQAASAAIRADAAAGKRAEKLKSFERAAKVMTYQEKRELTEQIHKLPGDKVDRVVEIIQQSRADRGLSGDQGDEVELDMDTLDEETLLKLK